MADAPVLRIATEPDNPYYSIRTKLDERDFTLEFFWNQREERWYMMVRDENEDLVRSGIKLVCNWPLIRFMKHDPRMPQGEFIVHDLTLDGSPPLLGDLGSGKRCELTYYGAVQL